MLRLFQRHRLTMSQKRVVKRGLDAGLTRLQVAQYAKPEFSPEQMDEIRMGLLEGLKPSEIRIFADARVSVEEMRKIRRVYRDANILRLREERLAEQLSQLPTRKSSKNNDMPL